MKYELDPVHEMMVDEMLDDDAPEEEKQAFISRLVDQTVYNTYQRYRQATAHKDSAEPEDLIPDAEAQ